MGTSSVSALNFVALGINTNALGVLLFGQLIVIQSVTELFSGIFSFKTWQSLNRFGAGDLAEGNYSRLRRRYLFALGLDFVAALAASLTAIVVFLFFIEAFGLDSELKWLGVVYAISAGFQIRSASVGIFRLTERFGIPIMFNVAEAAALVVNAAVLWWIAAPLEYYVYSIALIHVVTAIGVSLSGFIMVSRLEKHEGVRNNSDFGRREFMGFALAVSATGTIGIMLRRGEVLIISLLLGPAAAGLFGVAFRGAYFLARFAEAGKISVYPVIAKLVANREIGEAKRTVLRASLPVAGVALVIFLITIPFGRMVLELVFGEEFGAAYPNLLWLMAGTLTNACLFAALPLIENTIGAGRILKFSCIAFVAFLGASFGGLTQIGLPAGGMGGAAYFITLAALVVWQVRRIRVPADADASTDTP